LHSAQLHLFDYISFDLIQLISFDLEDTSRNFKEFKAVESSLFCLFGCPDGFVNLLAAQQLPYYMILLFRWGGSSVL